MNLVDINILVYGFNSSDDRHTIARSWLDTARRQQTLATCDTITSGFIRLVTNRKIFGADAVPASDAIAFIRSLRPEHLTGGEPVVDRLARLSDDDPGIRDNLVPDAWIAATALTHGASVATADAGFRRFPDLRIVNPLTD